jgi:hypothetical protein
MKANDLKKLLREPFRGFTADTGYRLYRGHTLFSRQGDVLLGVHFDLSRFRDSFALAAFIMPLFEPRETLDLTLGRRIGELPGKPQEWFDLSGDAGERGDALVKARREVQSKVLPWLAERNTPQRILDAYQSEPEHVEIWTGLGYCAAAVHDRRAAAKFWEFVLRSAPESYPQLGALLQAVKDEHWDAIDMQLQRNVHESELALRLATGVVTL